MANTKTTKTTESTTRKKSSTQGASSSTSVTRNVLDTALRDELLAGLAGMMTDEQLEAYARSLLDPKLSADREGAQQTYEAARLAGEQEMDDLAAALQQAIAAQRGAYRQSMADVETAALARGMGRSSYTLQTLANQGEALAQAVRDLTEESGRKQAQVRDRVAQAAQQNARTQARLDSDYAANLAAKLQELRNDQRREYNQHYMTATSAALGRQTDTAGTSSQQTTGQQTTSSTGTTKTQEIQPIFKTVDVPAVETGGSSSSSNKKKKKTQTGSSGSSGSSGTSGASGATGASGGLYTKNKVSVN